MAILVRKKGGDWREAGILRYSDEHDLQTMLYRSPQLIPVHGELTKARIFIEEAGLPGAGNTDLIGVDNDGETYIVECKLAKNPEMRRKVIGQILEYASFLWEMSYEDFDNLFVKRKRKTLRELLTERVAEGWEFEAFRKAVTENLKTGNFQLIIAVDEMNEQLEEIIAYLGSRSVGVRLQAIELQRYSEEETEILVPELHGECFYGPGGDRKTRDWDEKDFFAEAERRLGKEQVSALRKLYEFSKGQADWVSWGKGSTYGSLSIHINRISKRSLCTVTSNGHFVANFGQLNDGLAAIKFRDDLKRQLEMFEGLKIPANYQELWLSIPPEKWTPVVAELIKALHELLQVENLSPTPRCSK